MVEDITLSFANLPSGFDGTTVAVIADLHAGVRRGGAEGVRRVVELANGLEADLIVLLGDVIHHPRRASEYLPLLSELRARRGVWACLGNHEHGFVWISRHLGRSPGPSIDEWRAMYAEVGIELLVNEARPLQHDGSRLWLVGIDDAYSEHDDLPRALRNARSEEFCLGITHHPDVVDHPRISELDLVLAGHTHGGQVHVPILGPVHVSCRRPRERTAGLVRSNGTVMYVTRGVGEAIPIRIGCPRELPLITLRTGDSAARGTV
ncbi:MAG: metallophosphoesterase [Armatimonadota bacterium]|nr:metallophosphoesterase [Armatimonadota bacterium]